MDKLTAYRILGLKRNADFDAVREAYKVLIQDVHPEDEPERFSEIQNAYRLLMRLNSSHGANAHNSKSAPRTFEDASTPEESQPDRLDLDELFDDVEDGAYEKYAAELEFENDMDAINAFRNGLLHVKTIPPEYLAYLLKTYPFTKKDYTKLYAQLNGIRDEERTEKSLDATRPQGLLLRGAMWGLLFSIMLSEKGCQGKHVDL